MVTATAAVGDAEAQAQIHVVARKPVNDTVGGKADGTDAVEPQKKIVRWSGLIPPQKWMTFYMKVVSPFTTAAGLNLRVEVEVPADPGEQQAKVQLEKIRNALKELGLDDDADLR